MFTCELLKNELTALTDSTEFLIAYSGGLDSHVLLHAMQQWVQQDSNVQVKAIHINHQLSPHAAQWQQHCAQVCSELGVEFVTETVELNKKNGDSLEAIARDARYQQFYSHIGVQTCLLTAHTASDQTETLLLQLLRGAGPKGMAAMPAKKIFAEGVHLRPLLNFTRDDLLVYAQQHQLEWIEDESNTDTKFDRNYLRHEVIPILRNRWPSLTKTSLRVAQHCAEAAELLDEYASHDYVACSEDCGHALDLDLLTEFSARRQRNVLRYWCHRQTGKMPNQDIIRRIQHELITARIDANPQIDWHGMCLRRFQNKIYLTAPIEPLDETMQLHWGLQQPLQLPQQLGVLKSTSTGGRGISTEVVQNELQVRFRQGGEQIRPHGDAHTRSLKDLFQQWGVPPWQRGLIPLIFAGDKLVAVADYCVADDCVADDDQAGFVIEWQRF